MVVNPALIVNENELTRLVCVEGQSKKVRDISEFAEQEIILPYDGGPFEGQPFELRRQPYVRLLYREIMHGNWVDYIITGPSQSGKTLCSFVIILIWVLVELRKNLVCGVPDGNMVHDKWAIDIEPVFRASPTLEKLLPTTGPGSRGGTVKEFVQLGNGVRIRFMTAGGSDQSKAAFTATHMVVTEASRFSSNNKSSTSKEAGPLRQLRARQRSASRFDDDGNLNKSRQMWVEGTVTDEDDLPLSAREGSSDSKIVQQCVFCKSWVLLERQHLGGWEEAKSELQAAKLGSFFCPECGEAINEETRRVMVDRCELLHDGQKIDENGTISGCAPETGTLFFRWSGFQNLFLKIADLASEEWKAAQLDKGSLEWEEAEKELCQQVWCMPFRPEYHDIPLDSKALRKRTHGLPYAVLPATCEKLVYGGDVGRYRCWYFAISFNSDGTLHFPAHGAVDTSLVRGGEIQPEHEKAAIMNALREMFDMIECGLPMIGSTTVKAHDLTVIDGGYFWEAVQEVINEYGSGIHNKFKMIDGVGRSEMNARVYNYPKRTNAIVRKISKPPGLWHLEYRNGSWVIVLNSDQAKIGIQKCLRVEKGKPGSATFPQVPQRDLITVTRHLAAEVLKDGEWQQSGQNHLLDSGGYGWIGGNFLGWKMPAPERQEKKTEASWLESMIRRSR